MTNKYVWIGLAIGLFLAGLGAGYGIFVNMYNPYATMGSPAMFNQMMGNNPQFSGQYMGYMMQNPQYMSQLMSQNPQYVGQWMGYMMQDPNLRQQMYGYMLQNKDFMYGIMGNQTFQNQYMGPWMMQNPNFQRQLAIPGGQNNLGGGMMGGAGMGSGMMNNYASKSGSYASMPIKDADAEINTMPNNAQVSMDDNAITFNSSSVDIAMFAMMVQDAVELTKHNPPQSSHAQDDVFVAAGLVNPTLVVSSGTQLKITLVNLDEDMAHNFVITASAPPYSAMPMRDYMAGDNSGFLNTMPFLPNEEKEAGHAYEFTDSITLNQPGTYWYICSYPGHAEEGMYGKIIVR